MKYVIEGFATFIFLFLGFLSLAYGSSYYGAFGSALTFAFLYGFLMLAFSNIQKVYMNPLLSFVDCLRKKISVSSFWGCFFAQILASLAASILIFLLMLTSTQGNSILLGATWVCAIGTLSNIHLTIFGAIIFEIIISLVFVVIFFLIEIKMKALKSKFAIFGVLVGLFVLFTYGVTGTAANPAKAFGPAFVYLSVGEFSLIVHFVIFCASDILGALLGFLILKKFLKPEVSPDNKPTTVKEMPDTLQHFDDSSDAKNKENENQTKQINGNVSNMISDKDDERSKNDSCHTIDKDSKVCETDKVKPTQKPLTKSTVTKSDGEGTTNSKEVKDSKAQRRFYTSKKKREKK